MARIPDQTATCVEQGQGRVCSKPMVTTTNPAVDAAALVARIADALAHMPVPAATGLKRMTCSFGLAAAHSGEGLDSLMSRADTALYAAKDGGRDRMALAS